MWKDEALDHFPRKDEKGHHQSDQHWNCLKGNTGNTSDRLDRTHVGFLSRAHIYILS